MPHALGDIHGIGFDTDAAVSPERIFFLAGTQGGFGLQQVAGLYEVDEGFRRYEIAVGEVFQGDFDRLVLAMDDDTATHPGDATFRNIYLTGLGAEDATLQVL